MLHFQKRSVTFTVVMKESSLQILSTTVKDVTVNIMKEATTFLDAVFKLYIIKILYSLLASLLTLISKIVVTD